MTSSNGDPAALVQTALPGQGSPLPGANASPVGAPQADPVTGNVTHSVQLPSAGGFSPSGELTYNTQPAPQTSAFGTGWSSSLLRSVELISSDTVDVTTNNG